jgi:hypothetical protein
MKQKEALDLVQEFLKAHGMEGDEIEDEAVAEERSDQGKGEDMFAGGDPDLAFRYFSDSGVLKCYSLIYQFADPPRPGILDACRDEAKKKTTDMGGGELEYDAEDQGLYLTRSYTHPVSVSQLTKDLEKLQAACVYWGEDVLDRVAARVFHPEELPN